MHSFVGYFVTLPSTGNIPINFIIWQHLDLKTILNIYELSIRKNPRTQQQYYLWKENNCLFILIRHVLLAANVIKKIAPTYKKHFEKIIKLIFSSNKKLYTCCPTFSMLHFPRSATFCNLVFSFNPCFPVVLFFNLKIFLLKLECKQVRTQAQTVFLRKL